MTSAFIENSLIALARDRSDGKMRESQQPIVIRPRQRSGQLEPLETIEYLFEDHANFESREVGAETEMRAESEAHVKVRIAADIEAKRIFEYVLVAICRHFPHRHFLTFADFPPSQLRVVSGRAPLVNRGRGPAHDLLSGGLHK